MYKYSFFIISLLFIIPAAFGVSKPTFSAELAAEYTGKSLNEMGTVDELLKMVEKHVPQDQYERAVSSLSKMQIEKKMKIPNVKVEGNKIYFDKNNYIMIQDSQIMVINGFVFKKSSKPYDTLTLDIFETLSAKKVSSILIPSAHAFSFLLGMLAIAGATMVGSFMSPAWGQMAPNPYGNIASMYMAQQLFSGNRSQSIYCGPNGQYMRRPSNIAPAMMMMNGGGSPVDAYLLSQVFQQQTPPCTPAYAQSLQRGINNWGSGVRPTGPGRPVMVQPVPGRIGM